MSNKRKQFDLLTKYRAIEAIESGRTQQQVADDLGTKKSTINGWFAEREKIKQAHGVDMVLSSRKRLRTAK